MTAGRRPGGAVLVLLAVLALGVLTGCGLPGSAQSLGTAAAAEAPAATEAPAPAPATAAPATEAPTTEAPATSAAAAATPAPAAPAPATGATTVTIANFEFGPASLTVPAGATVMVVNNDGANHTVLAMDGSFDTGNIPGKGTGTFTAPSTPGSYPYKCAIHPFMTGTLVVT